MAMMGTGRASGDNRARDAAEAAIRSPLLEDVDLHGARGILVNVTAGPDLNIGEFTDVGSIVDDFASDQATVVVGTVIDPEMCDELKVTVVATGLADSGRPNVVVDNTAALAGTGPVDYAKLDRPAYARQHAVQPPVQPTMQSGRGQVPSQNSPQHAVQNSVANPASGTAQVEINRDSLEQQDMEYLDIPAFLRRQAD